MISRDTLHSLVSDAFTRAINSIELGDIGDDLEDDGVFEKYEDGDISAYALRHMIMKALSGVLYSNYIDDAVDAAITKELEDDWFFSKNYDER